MMMQARTQPTAPAFPGHVPTPATDSFCARFPAVR
jgi:hypothetical protein